MCHAEFISASSFLKKGPETSLPAGQAGSG
jgi:hypothetical protein